MCSGSGTAARAAAGVAASIGPRASNAVVASRRGMSRLRLIGFSSRKRQPREEAGVIRLISASAAIAHARPGLLGSNRVNEGLEFLQDVRRRTRVRLGLEPEERSAAVDDP